jgi:glycosyltransferase involved in cell wall biosynthesis
MDYPLRKGATTRFLYTWSVDMVVAISAGVQTALLAGGVPAARIRLIPSGIDTTHFTPDPAARTRVRQAYGFGDDETIILTVGALVERKGHRTLLAAAQHLKTHGRRLRYLVCGEGTLRAALEAEVRALGLTPEVRFAGFCADIPGILAAADLFVHVPLYEGLGVAVIEALAAGLPVVASRVGGIPELIDDGTTGLLVPPQDPCALATALDRLVSDPLLAGKLGRAGQAMARTRFDVAVMARKNETLYAELLGAPYLL